MAMQTIKLGGYVDEEVKKVNDNFAEIEADYAKKIELPTVPTKVSDLENDSNFQTATQVQNAIDSALGTVEGELPTDLGDLTNNAGYVKSTDAVFVNKVDKEAGKGLYPNPDAEKVAKLGKITFASNDFTQGSDGYYSATIAAAGKVPVKVMRQNGSDYEEVLAHTKVSGDNIVIVSSEAFAGYVATI